MQCVLHMGSTPTRVLVKDGMMYSVVVKSAANCGIGIVVFTDNLYMCTVAVNTLIYEALVLVGTCGVDGAI